MESKWEEHWQNFSGLAETGTFYGKWASKQKLLLVQQAIEPIFFKDYEVLDIGCGSGETLTIFKQNGFHDLYGIDSSLSALKHCEEKGFKLGLNIFQEDARHTQFVDRAFGIVFEEGLWEHYPNYTPFVHEACRLTYDYLIALQPNHFSFLGATTKIGWELFSRNKGGLKEYSIPLSHFKLLIKHQNFHLIREHFTFLKGYSCMVFRRGHQTWM